MTKIILLRTTLVLSWFTAIYLCCKMWTNTTYVQNWHNNFQLLCFWKLQQLQQGHSSIFLMGGWEFHPCRKNLRNSKLGSAVTTRNTYQLPICNNNCTTKRPRKAFLSPYFLNLCTDTAEYCSIKLLLVNCRYNTLQVRFFCCLWTLNVFNNSFSLANKQRRNYVKNLTKTI